MENKNHSGFTLVEISIVLVIIGLIVGGILVGTDLIKSARVRSAVKQMEEINAAHNTYKLRYAAIPGDDPNAANTLTGVTGAGNGDGYVFSNLSVAGGTCFSACPRCGGVDSEVTWYWQDLRAAGLFSYPYAANSSAPADNLPEFKLAPRSYILPTCTIASNSLAPAALPSGSQVYILGTNAVTVGNRIQYMIPGIFGSTGAQADAISAFDFDTKLDDGFPTKGRVRALSGCAYNQASYDMTAASCDSSLVYRWE